MPFLPREEKAGTGGQRGLRGKTVTLRSGEIPSRNNPEILLRQLVAIALVSIAAILSLAGYGIYRVYAGQVIANAETSAIHVSEVLVAQERGLLLEKGEDGGIGVVLRSEKIPDLDRRLRRFLRPFSIVKIKIFAADSTIVYSTDASIIGLRDEGNPRLQRALSGQNDSQLVTRDRVLDLAEEQIIDVDVVETYVPIRVGLDRVVGAIEIYVDVTRYREEIREVVTRTVILLGLTLLAVFFCSFLVVRKATLQLKTVQDQLQKLATTDPLTGIFNRREILDRADHEFLRVRRSRLQSLENVVGFIMIDIDHFKRINDSFGHQCGDAVLCEIALRLKGAIRGYDVVGRYGGEEFLTVLPGASLEKVRAVGDRMLETVAGRPIEVMGQSIEVTGSFGISVTRTDEDDIEPALRRADEALYRAKMKGRNRVCGADEGPVRTAVRDGEETGP
jgi:diguanylate cyclase (GGDEF)-like protein